MARVAIIGVGSIGSVLAAQLYSTERHELLLCTRRPLEKIKVKTSSEEISVKATTITDVALAESVDWIILATKTYDAKGAAAWFPKLCKENTRIAVVQNGVEHREWFADGPDLERILPVIINCPAERQSDGTILQRGTLEMHVEAQPSGQDFAQLFEGAKVAIDLTEDFISAAWRKLCMNSAGAISALLMKPVGVLQNESLGQVALDIMRECAAVGRAEGARIEDDIGQKVLRAYREQPADSINSMLADRIAGRPMEIDARNGIIVRKGQRHGIDTPSNRMVVALLRALDGARCEP
jgi:2-dehydropantoate 2-reductase